jgi:hypothetical protein
VRAPEAGGEPEPGPKQEETPTTNHNGGGTGNISGGTGNVAGSTGGAQGTPGIATTPQAVEELVLGCSKRSLVLNDVLIDGGRVALQGSAAKSLDGKRVKILFDGSSRGD